MSRQKLSPQKAEELRASLNGWQFSDDKEFIEKEFTFADFKQAWAFMTAVAEKAEEMDHHPNWSNVYNHVHISLTTHDQGGLSQLDFDMATFMDQLEASSASQKSIN